MIKISEQEKKKLREEISKKAASWLMTGETGISSKTMLGVALGIKMNRLDAPCDPSDFRRCHLLVKKIPEIKNFFPEIAKKVPQFKGILENWNELEKVLKKDEKFRASSELYALIKRHRGEELDFYRHLEMAHLGYQESIDYIKKPEQSLYIEKFVLSKRFSCESYESFKRALVDVTQGGAIDLRVNQELKFVLNLDRIINNKSSITEPLAKELIRFVEGGHYDDEDKKKASTLMTYFKKKFPDIGIEEKVGEIEIENEHRPKLRRAA